MGGENRVGLFLAMTPIVAGKELRLRAHLHSLPEDKTGPFASVPHTHFARFVIVPEMSWEGFRQRPDALKSQYLLFSGWYDEPLQEWLDGLVEGLGADQITDIWGCCAGFTAPSALKYYLLHNQLADVSLLYAAYHASVDEVRRSLECQRDIRDFVLANQGTPDAGLQQAWQQRFGRLEP